jgi:hypothetical protein
MLCVMEPDPLLQTCEALLELLYANQEHVKLRRLVADIEDLRDRLLREAQLAAATRNTA